MKHGWKNLIGLSLMVLAVSACGGKKGGGDGGTAATPPATGSETPPPTDGIPETNDQRVDVNPGTWSGRLNIVDQDAYKAYMKKVLNCKGACTSSTGYMKVRFDIFRSHLPTNKTNVSTESRVFCNEGRKAFKFQLAGRTATSNVDNNGFQLSYFLSGRYSNRNLMDSEDAPAILAAYNGDQSLMAIPKLQFVLIYKDASRTNVTGRVYFKGTKIAEGDMTFDELDFREFGNFYDDSINLDLDRNDRDDRWDRDDRDHRPRRLVWRNGRNYNDNGFNFDLFFKQGGTRAYLNMNF